jgi:hypothetical protein
VCVRGRSRWPAFRLDFPRRPRAVLSDQAGVPAFSSTFRDGFRPGPRTLLSAAAVALVPGNVRGRFRSPQQLRVVPLASEDARIPSHDVRRLAAVRGRWFSSARSHWFRPTQARWFPAGSEDPAFRRRSRFGSWERPRTFPLPAAVASRSPGARKRWVPLTRRAITSGRPRTPFCSCACASLPNARGRWSVPRGAWSSASVRGRWFPATLRVGFRRHCCA